MNHTASYGRLRPGAHVSVIVEDAKRRAAQIVPSHNAQVIVSYHEAIGRLQGQIAGKVYSGPGIAAAQRLIRRYEDHIARLATPQMVAA